MVMSLDGKAPTLKTIHKVACAADDELSFSIAPSSRQRMERSRRQVEKIVKEGRPVYGINTGLGALANQRIGPKDLEQLQLNLVRSHCTGVGAPFGREMVRGMMFLRANCLVHGYSGIAPSLVDLLLTFLEKGVTPVVPQRGSVGASGDLAPLAHIALALIGEGEVEFQGRQALASEALQGLGVAPASLGPKDGLSLINGTAVMAAQLALGLYQAQELAQLADVAACLTLDALKGTDRAYHEEISRLKPHPGQLAVCKNLNRLLAGSEILASHKNCDKIQDPYSLRCVPQVHGACRQTLIHAEGVLEIELGSVTDNPLLFLQMGEGEGEGGGGEVISGGNFHGEALALAMDYLALGLAEFASMSERRIEKMMNPTYSGLPAFLASRPGLESGLMIAHVTAAALASENKIYCHPASVDSIPTSTDKEDHVSMGVTSGHKLQRILENLSYGLSLEFLCATQALEFCRPLQSSPSLEAAAQAVWNQREGEAKGTGGDRPLHRDVERIKRALPEILRAVAREMDDGGELL